jgi:two-component system, cell cycle sensor histidine kinase and response regulator CckA
MSSGNANFKSHMRTPVRDDWEQTAKLAASQAAAVSSESHFKLLFEYAPDAYFLHDLSGRLLAGNLAAVQLTGHPRGELVGKTFAESGLLTPDQLPNVARTLEKCATGQATEPARFTIMRKDGRPLTVEIRSFPLRIAGEPLILAIARDVTDRMHAEERMRESEARSRLIAEATFEGICVSEDGIIRDANPQMAAMMGRELSEFVGMPVIDLVAPEARSTVTDRIRRGVEDAYEHLAVRSDGTVFPVEVHGKTMEYRGRMVRVTAVRDISGRRRIEEELRENAQRLKVLFEYAPDAIFVCKLSGEAVDGNLAIEELTGYSRSELAGRRFDQMGVMRGDEVAHAADILVRSAAGKRTGPDVFSITRKDGATVAVEVRTFPVRMKDRQLVLGIAHDVTERLRTEDALRGLIEHAIYGIYRSTPDGRFLSANPALIQLLGYDSASELLDVDIGRDVYVNSFEREMLMRRFRDHESVPDAELTWKRKDGQKIAVRVAARPLHDAAGELTGFEAFVEDITERKQLEDQLRQAQKMEAVGQLTGGIAHDFNNLLSVIRLNAELAQETMLPGDAMARACLRDVGEAASKATAIVKQLLGFSRQAALNMVPTDLARITTDLAPMLKRVLPEHIDLQILARHGVAIARADAGAVEQILVNLATNARDAMPDGGRLTIELEACEATAKQRAEHPWIRPGAFVRITVTDTGVGMSRETSARLFEPFFTTKPAGMGTGLGMAMVYGLIKQHDGFVNVYSELGEGTTIRLYFPAVSGAAVQRRKEEWVDLPGGTETVLLVEDEDSVRSAASRVLTKRGYTVLTAANGHEGLANYRANAGRIDIVVSDLVMPGMGGADLYQALLDDGSAPKFILVSGYSEREAETRAKLGRGVPFLEKPWTFSKLLKCVRETLDGGDAES